ncbi:MAG: nicotinate-nucleotide adenylyltransferase [Emergencia sp.]
MHKIGILGGSFDPIHYGHIAIATSALEECKLDKVILMPTKNQPFKVGRHSADESDRLNMVRIVAEEYEGFICSPYEMDHDYISYTYNTLTELERIYEDSVLYFILGTDSFLDLETWYKGKELLSRISFIVAVRPGYKESETMETIERYRNMYHSDITVLNNPVLNISSTNIRRCVEEGKPINQFVPQCIEEYINEHGLYKEGNI